MLDLATLDEYADTGADYEFARALHQLTDELRATREVVRLAQAFHDDTQILKEMWHNNRAARQLSDALSALKAG